MFTKVILPNKLRLITVPMSGVSTVTILVMVNTGSNNETKEINGISHFLEHMFFKGTARRPSSVLIAQELERLGAYSNAFTGREWTGYLVKVRAPKFGEALDLIADIFQHSLIDPAEVEKERGVILQEYRMYEDDPQRRVGELFEEVLYGDQPAGWHIEGTPEHIARISADELLDYFLRQYTIENTFVVVAGNLNQTGQGLEEHIVEAFGAVRAGMPHGRPPVAEQQPTPALKIRSKETDQTHIVLGVRAFGIREEAKRYPAVLMSHILGGGMASRLFQEIRVKRGLAYAVGASFDGYITYGSVASYAGVEHANAMQAIPLILEEYRKIREGPVSAEELSRAKESLKGRLAISLESSDDLAFYVGGQEVQTGKPMTPEEFFVKIDAVSAEDIRAVANEIFRPERLNLAMVGPIRDAERFQELLNGFHA